jgi:ABC-2 type transport system ATP-binding protein
MNNNLPAIHVDNLTKRFGNKTVVDKLTLTVNRGDIFGFLGPNGSGKTTSIRLLCGLLTPDEGTGQCLGYDIFTQSQQIKRNVGYMTQRFSFYEDLSIRENLEFIARIYQMKNRKQAVDGALMRLGLGDRQQQLAGTLSGGWKQRMALAACMLHEPQLLLLDEPTAGVDPKARREFWDEIHRLSAEGITILVSTHYMDEAERCHRLAYIAYGHLLAQGTPDEMISQSDLSTWTVTGDNIPQLANQLRNIKSIEQVVVFGNTLHISGSDVEGMNQDLIPYKQNTQWQWDFGEPRLEDVFIHLMQNERAP